MIEFLTAQNRILALLAAWDNWSIYPPLYITGLEASFMRKTGDLEAKDLTGVEEASLDKEALSQKANQVRACVCVSLRVFLRYGHGCVVHVYVWWL